MKEVIDKPIHEVKIEIKNIDIVLTALVGYSGLKPTISAIKANNVEINSDFVNIKAESAVYDDIKDVISILGKPSIIKSSKKDTSFNGKAEIIMFFDDEKIHLIGNASMKYENISISSNIIIFNPRTGKISSE